LFNTPSGTASYLGNSRTGDAYFLLEGDLNQMGIMERRLRDGGFNVARSSSGTYPGFPKDQEAEYLRALKWLYERRVEGWWNQRLVEHKVCTQAEFDAALTKFCEDRKKAEGK
jgi:hypothetical protein